MLASAVNVLVTMRFNEAQLDRLRQVSPGVRVTREDPAAADYSRTDVLYAGAPPRDLGHAPNLKWVQLHMAGVDALAEHPLYVASAIPLVTASGVHASIAEYAITMLLALAHRVPRVVEWQGRGGWPPDEQRWSLFVPSEVRGATLGIVGYGSIGRELARIAKTAFAMSVLACKREPSQRKDSGYTLPGTGDPDGLLPDAWLGPDGLPELLARALSERRIAGAAIDVFAQEPPPAGHPLYALDNVIASPHVSGFLPSYDDTCADLFAENLRRYLAGAPLLNVVDRARGY